jgi:hypothetical protein
MAKDSTGRSKNSPAKQATITKEAPVNKDADKKKTPPKNSSKAQSKSEKTGASPKTEKPAQASKPRKGLAPAVAEQAAPANPLKSQVDAELRALDAKAKSQGETTFCECAVSTKEDDLITAQRIRRVACQRFSILHADDYNVAMD